MARTILNRFLRLQTVVVGEPAGGVVCLRIDHIVAIRSSEGGALRHVYLAGGHVFSVRETEQQIAAMVTAAEELS